MNSLLGRKEYDFIRNDIHLGSNVCLLALGGSHAYGTNVEGSDIDVRGICLNGTEDILGMGTDFEQYTDKNTDTVIYKMNKIVKLLSQCNPNVIEILGCKEEHYLYKNDIGQMLLDNSNIFLSKRAFYTFSGYAKSQLEELEYYISKDITTKKEYKQHLLVDILKKVDEYNIKYAKQISLNVSKVENMDTDLLGISVQMDSMNNKDTVKVLKLIGDLNKRISNYNNFNLGHSRKQGSALSKHAMHLIRLYYMCIDILKKQEINTYREKEIGILLDIRNNDIVDKDGSIKKSILDLKCSLEKEMQVAFDNSSLRDRVDNEAINKLMYTINIKTLKARGIIH